MKLPLDSTRWSAQFVWVELARHHQDQVFRIQQDHEPVLIRWPEDIDDFRDKYNNTGLYTSIFRMNQPDVHNASRLSNLYFDLDDKAHPEKAQADTIKLYQYLLSQKIPKEFIRIYFSGMKGFHLEIEALALGVGPTADLPGLFRYIAQNLVETLSLTTLDMVVYEPRRMWRLPYSIHQSTGLYKCEISEEQLFGHLYDIQNYAKNPEIKDIDEPDFSAAANEWYRSWIYKKETKKLSVEDMIERFSKYGTGYVRKVDETEKDLVFDPKKLLDNCHAVKDIWNKAETKGSLSHEERLFLCSLLTYTDDAIEYLHQIISLVGDYNPDKTQAHIDDWIKRRQLGIGGRPFTCSKANAMGVGCGDCDLEPKQKWETYGDRVVATGEYADPSPIRFCYSKNS